MVTFILPAYKEKFDPLVSLGSLLCQTDDRWKAIVVYNSVNHKLERLVNEVREHSGFKIEHVMPREFTENALSNRHMVLHKVVDTEWVVSASISDYYLPKTVEEILKVADNADFVMWNSLNHHFHDNVPLDCQPRIRKIDWGNMAIRTEIAKTVDIVGLNDWQADGEYAEALHAKHPNMRSVKIPKILTVHV